MNLTNKTNSKHYTWGNQCDGWHLVQSNNLSVIQEKMPPGTSETKHLHHKAEQFFYVLSGIATMQIEINGESKTLLIEKDNGLHIPAGTIHCLSNEQNEDLHFLVTSTPPSHGDRVEV